MTDNPTTPDRRARVAAALREHGMVHLGDQAPADEYDCCAEAAIAALLPDDTDLTEADIDRMMAAGVPVQIVTAPPGTRAAVPVPPTTTTADEERRQRYAAALLGPDAAGTLDSAADEMLNAVLAVADAEQAELGEQLDAAGETIAQRTAALSQADERVEFYEAAHARMRDRLEVTQVQTERRRLALSEALDLGTGAPWDAIHERVQELSAAVDTSEDRCAECGHFRGAHEEAEEPVSVGRCTVCADEDEWHDFEAVEELRRLAAEAQQQPDTETRPGCPDPIECSHEAALGQAEEKLDAVHALGTAWSRPTMSAPTRVAGEHLLRLLNEYDPGEEPVPGPGRAADEEQGECRCPHPVDEHSVYGCADGCGCEWMPRRNQEPRR